MSSISERVQTADSQAWGEADYTMAEIAGLFHYAKQQGWSVDEVRARLLEAMKQGLFAIPDGLTAKETLEAGLQHACPVMPGIFAQFSDENLAKTPEMTFWSYTTKNRAFRAIYNILNSFNAELAEAWRSERDKMQTMPPTAEIVVPEGMEDTLKGISRVECYWPCQLFRYIQAEVLGLESVIDGIEDYQRQHLKTLPYEELEMYLVHSQTVEEVGTNILLWFVSHLVDYNWPSDLIAQIVVKGYSPRGSIMEHGEVEYIKELWQKILVEISNHPTIMISQPELVTVIKTQVTKRFAEAGVEFS